MTNLRKLPVIVFISLLLAACGGGGGGATPPPVIPTINATYDNFTIFVNDTDETYHLVVMGSGNTIDIATDNTIEDFTLTGSNNLITFNGNTTVNTIDVAGNDNTFMVPTGSGITIDSVLGSGNSVIEYQHPEGYFQMTAIAAKQTLAGNQEKP